MRFDRLTVAMGFLVASVAGGQARAAAAPNLQGTWQGVATRNGQRWSIRLTAWHTATGARVCFDFPDYGLYYRCTSDVVATDVGIRIRYVSGRDVVTLDGQLASAAYTGRWNGLGVDAEFRLERSGTSPEPLVEENVKFRNGDLELAGTIVRPAAKHRYPAVVWTHGSGKQRRSEDFYRDRAYLLAEHGLAALIYDKRGVGDSGGDPESTLDELAGDAVAAVQFLQRREEIDPNAVGIGGFSQGGYVAPLAAARYGRIRFVVTGAAPGVTPAEQNDFAALTALTRRGLPADAIERAMTLRREVLHAQETGDRLAAVNQELAIAQTETWFRVAELPATVQPYGRRGLSVVHFDPHPVWTRIAVPVLAIWGEDDALVPVERSKQSIESWLKAGGNRDVTLLVYPGAGHGLAMTGRPGVWDWPRLAPGFLDAMLKWIVAHVSSGGSR